MNIATQKDVLSICLSQSYGESSRSRLEECLNKLLAIQELMFIEEGGEPTLLDVLDRVIRFYERFVPIGSHANICRFEIDDQLPL